MVFPSKKLKEMYDKLSDHDKRQVDLYISNFMIDFYMKVLSKDEVTQKNKCNDLQKNDILPYPKG